MVACMRVWMRDVMHLHRWIGWAKGDWRDAGRILGGHLSRLGKRRNHCVGLRMYLRLQPGRVGVRLGRLGRNGGRGRVRYNGIRDCEVGGI